MSGNLAALTEEQGTEKGLGIPGGGITAGIDMNVFNQGRSGNGLNFMAEASERAGSDGFLGNDGNSLAMIDGAGNYSTVGVLVIGRVKLAGIVRAAASGEPAVKLYQLSLTQVRHRLFDGNLTEAFYFLPTVVCQHFTAAKDKNGTWFVGKIEGSKGPAGFGDIGLGDDTAAYGSEPRLGLVAMCNDVIIGIIVINKFVTQSGSTGKTNENQHRDQTTPDGMGCSRFAI